MKDISKEDNIKTMVKELKQIVDEQAEDPALWFVAERASEAYLQQELRKLHTKIEDLTQQP